MKHLPAILLIGLIATSCTLFEHKNQEGAYIQLGNEYLTKMQLDEVTYNAASPEDSAALAQAYIKQWAEDILFYQKASKAKDSEIEALTANYRRSLYLHKFEERLINKEMPKDVDPDSIKAYYEQNPELFKLSTNIVKGLLIAIPKDAPNQPKLKKWLQAPADNIEDIEKYAYQYATGYELFLDNWVSSNQINMKMPVGQKGLTDLLKKENNIEASDSTQIYLLRVTDKRLIDDTMPLDFAEEEIRAILLSNRRVAFLQDYRNRLYQDANIEQKK